MWFTKINSHTTYMCGLIGRFSVNLSHCAIALFLFIYICIILFLKMDNLIKIQNKNVLVTGGGSGIGLAIVQALAPYNNVYVVDKQVELLHELKRKFDSVTTIHADLSDWDGVTKALEDALPDVVHGLVNNAGIGGKGGVLDLHDTELLDKMINVNARAIVCVSQIVAKKFIAAAAGAANTTATPHGYCSIVNVSSLASKFPTRVSVGYNMTKAAVDMLTKSMALELGPHNIRVNSVNPGMVFGTDLSNAWVGAAGEALRARLMARTPLGKCVGVDDVVKVVLFLLWDEGVRMVHGEQVVIDGGYMVA